MEEIKNKQINIYMVKTSKGRKQQNVYHKI